MLKFKRKKNGIKPVPITKLLPNLITLSGLIIGSSSIRFALDSRWEIAIYCILTATLIDGLDGGVARMLNATSHFGAELDSLCDFMNFGLCPAMLIYLWSFGQYEYKVISWSAIMLFLVCMAIRLARFNTTIIIPTENKPDDRFLLGVPAPSGAILALIPMILDFEFLPLFGDFSLRNHTLVINVYIIIIALLLPSRLPTISLKKIHIKPEYLSLSMIVSAIIIITLMVYPWYLLPIAAIIYILSIPICMYIAHNEHKISIVNRKV